MSNDFRFLMYQSAEENVSVNAVIKDETIWLSQKGMAELFGVQPPAITKHLQNIYDEGELSRDATLSKMEIVQKETHINIPPVLFVSAFSIQEAALPCKDAEPQKSRGGLPRSKPPRMG